MIVDRARHSSLLAEFMNRVLAYCCLIACICSMREPLLALLRFRSSQPFWGGCFCFAFVCYLRCYLHGCFRVSRNRKLPQSCKFSITFPVGAILCCVLFLSTYCDLAKRIVGSRLKRGWISAGILGIPRNWWFCRWAFRLQELGKNSRFTSYMKQQCIDQYKYQSREYYYSSQRTPVPILLIIPVKNPVFFARKFDKVVNCIVTYVVLPTS